MGLETVPFYGAYMQRRQMNEQKPLQELQQASGALGLMQALRQQEQEQQLQQALAQSGGDPEKALQAAIASGNLAGAAKLAPIIEARRKAQPQPRVVPSGAVVLGPDNSVVFSNPSQEPREAAPPELIRLQEYRKRYRDMGLTDDHPVIKEIDGRIKTINERPAGLTVQMPTSSDTMVGEDGKTYKVRIGRDGKMEAIPLVTQEGVSLSPPNPAAQRLNVAGMRESVYVQRMMMGANQAAKDLANVVQLPLTASTGLFGGRRQGAGLLDATKEVLANKATGQEAQAYNAMATGFQRSLAQIESAGLMPSGSLTHQMDAVLFKEGDTNLTKLHKLAQTRQIVEAGMEVIEANPRVSEQEKAKVKEVLASIRKSVPFTHSDLIRLQVEQEKNPAATLGSVLNSGKGAGSSATQTPGGATVSNW